MTDEEIVDRFRGVLRNGTKDAIRQALTDAIAGLIALRAGNDILAERLRIIEGREAQHLARIDEMAEVIDVLQARDLPEPMPPAPTEGT